MSKCEQCIVREFSSLKALNKEELVKLSECKESYTIKKGDVSPTDLHGFNGGNKDNFYRIYKNNKGFFTSQTKLYQIPILSIEIEEKIHNSVLEYLEKIKSVIEKRLGKKIEISLSMNLD